MNTNGVTALDALRHNNEASVERLVPSSSAELLGSSRFTYCLASTLAMSPRPAPLQRYATAAIHPTDSSEKPAMKSRSRSVMPAKARSVSIEPPPRPGLQRQATTAVHKIHEAQTSAAGTAVTESRYSKHARNLSLQNRKPSTRRSLKKLSSFRRLAAPLEPAVVDGGR